MLLSLFAVCLTCSNSTVSCIRVITGTFVQVQQLCRSCGHKRLCNSQPYIGNVPAGNLLLSTAILCAGALPSMVLRFLKYLKCSSICKDTLYRHQTAYLQPCISTVWMLHQRALLSSIQLQEEELVAAGDGRSDSPGYTAKFGSYTLMDLKMDKVITFELIQSNEVGGSYNMEKQGLVQALSSLNDCNVHIDVLVTDRHVQIKNYLREEHQEIKHYFDVWHIAKCIKKKLSTLARETDCGMVQPWIKSVTNHIYWTAASTPNGDEEIMVSKWKPLTNHLLDIHSGHDGPYTKCEHGPLVGDQRNKQWYKPGTKSKAKLSDILLKKTLLNDIKNLSLIHQTSSNESSHGLINHFAPKMYAFSFLGLLCRLALAALHYNENSKRPQATTTAGKLQYKLQFPRYAKGECRAKPVKVDPTFNYVDEITTEVVLTAKVSRLTGALPAIDVPPPLTAAYDKPTKDDVVNAHQRRFAEQQTSSDTCVS